MEPETTINDVPAAIVEIPQKAVESTNDVLLSVIRSLEASIAKGVEVNEKLLDHLTKVPEEVVESVEEVSETPEEIVPEVPVKPPRIVRRGNRKVKRV